MTISEFCETIYDNSKCIRMGEWIMVKLKIYALSDAHTAIMRSNSFLTIKQKESKIIKILTSFKL